MDSVPDEELELYFDLFFGTILESGITSINDLFSRNAIDHVRQLVSQAQTLEPEQVEILKNLHNSYWMHASKPGKIIFKKLKVPSFMEGLS